MGTLVSLAKHRRERTHQLRHDIETCKIAATALWLPDLSRLTVVMTPQGRRVRLDGRPLTFEESQAINRYIDHVGAKMRARKGTQL